MGYALRCSTRIDPKATLPDRGAHPPFQLPPLGCWKDRKLLAQKLAARRAEAWVLGQSVKISGLLYDSKLPKMLAFMTQMKGTWAHVLNLFGTSEVQVGLSPHLMQLSAAIHCYMPQHSPNIKIGVKKGQS